MIYFGKSVWFLGPFRIYRDGVGLVLSKKLAIVFALGWPIMRVIR